jgi:uroporphyrinogen-III synthase
MTGRPLAGKRVLVTRPRSRAAALEASIRDAGGEPILWPAIEIADPEDFGPFDRVVGRLESFDLAIFISPTAVERAFARMKKLGIAWPRRPAIAAIGPGTRRALADRGFDQVIAPSDQADSERLLALPALAEMRDRQVVIFRGTGGRELLATILSERGASVEYAECYRRARPVLPASPPPWAAQSLHAVLVSSSEGLANVAEALGRFRPQWTDESVLFVAHPRVGEEAARLGVREVALAGPGDEEFLARLVAYFRDAK